MEKVIYYSDELNDEFAGDQITARKIDETYNYDGKSLSWRFKHFLLYRIVGLIFAPIIMKLKYHHKVVNRKVVKPYLKTGYFIYGNHTNNGADVLIPIVVNHPTDTFFLVNANNVSLPFLGKLTPYFGALPLPDTLSAGRNFMNTMKYHVEKNKCVLIYPEAHIWPFYTKIRPFLDSSFKYPVEFDKPVFCFTNTYQKRHFGKKPKMVTYVDGPFFADKSLKLKEQRKYLRDMCYNAMVERSKNSNLELIKYVKREEIKTGE